jgi:hypothetical protein
MQKLHRYVAPTNHWLLGNVRIVLSMDTKSRTESLKVKLVLKQVIQSIAVLGAVAVVDLRGC